MKGCQGEAAWSGTQAVRTAEVKEKDYVHARTTLHTPAAGGAGPSISEPSRASERGGFAHPRLQVFGVQKGQCFSSFKFFPSYSKGEDFSQESGAGKKIS